MSFAKRNQSRQGGDIFTIGEDNPYIGSRVAVRWLKAWGGADAGHEAIGTLLATFVVNGRTLIGIVKNDDGISINCPWSRRFLNVQRVG